MDGSTPTPIATIDLTINVGILLRGLDVITGSIEADRNNPITGFVSIVPMQDVAGVVLRGRSWIQEAEVYLDADVDPASTGICVPSDLLARIVAGLKPEASVTIACTNGKTAHITSGRSKYRAAVINPEDYSVRFLHEDGITLRVPAKDLVTIIKPCLWAVESDINRPMCDAVYLHTVDGKLAAVATNGKKLGYRHLPVASMPADFSGGALPSSAAQEMLRLLAHEPGDVTLTFADSTVSMVLMGQTFIARQLHGDYFPYQRIIPQGDPVATRVVVAELHAVVDRMLAAISTDREAILTTKISIKDGLVHLRCGPSELPLATEELPTTVLAGAVYFVNLKWLSQMLEQWPADTVLNLHCNTPGQPLLFTADALPEMKHLIMPVHPKGGEL